MALLKNDNVIFYHPLDNYIDNIPGETWSGSIWFTSGQIISGITPSVEAFTSGNSCIVSNTSGVEYKWVSPDKGIVAIDDTHALHVWADIIPSVSNYIRARLVEISGNIITSGNMITLGTSSSTNFWKWNPTAAHLEDGNIIIAYNDNNYDLQFCRLLASGNTLIEKNRYSPSQGVYPRIDKLSSTHAIVVYRLGGYNHHAKILQLSGDSDIIGGNEYTFIDEDPNGEELIYSIDRLSDSKVIIGYCTPFNGHTQASGLVAEISGTTINYGSHYQITNNGFFSQTEYGATFCIHTLSDSKLIVSYLKTGPYVYSKIITVSGTTLNFGGEQAWPQPTGRTDIWLSIVPISDSEIMVSHYTDWAGEVTHGRPIIHNCMIDGDNLLFGSGYINYIPDIYELPGFSLEKMTNNKIIVGIWGEETDLKRSYIIDIYPSSLISTLTPENYTSISGAQHLTCGFWSKFPTSNDNILTIQDGYGIKLTSDSISFMPSGAIWNDANIITYLSGINDGGLHLTMIDLVYSGSNSWVLKTSADGSGWVNHGLPNSGIQPIIDSSGIPMIDFYDRNNYGSLLDELVFYAGDFNITDQELVNLYELGSVYQESMDKYGDYYGNSINNNCSLFISTFSGTAIDDNIACFINSHINTSSTLSLFMCGHELKMGSPLFVSLFTEGFTGCVASGNLFTKGHLSFNVGFPNYINGLDAQSGSMSLFTYAPPPDLYYMIKLYTVGPLPYDASINLYIAGDQSMVTSGNLFINGCINNVASGSLFIMGPQSIATSGNLFINGYIDVSGVSALPLFIYGHDALHLYIYGYIQSLAKPIDWLLKSSDHYPQIIGTLEGATSVNIQLWEITDGQNALVSVASSDCYQIGNTGRWAWSTVNLPTYETYQRQYFYIMIANNGGTFEGQFFLELPEGAKWIHPSSRDDSIL